MSKALRDGIEPARRNDVAGERLVRGRVVELNGPVRLDALGKIALPLELRGHRGHLCGWVPGARTEVADKENGGRVLHHLGNDERSSGYEAKPALRVRRLRHVLSGNGKRLGVYSGVGEIEKHHAMNPVGLAPVAELARLLIGISALPWAATPPWSSWSAARSATPAAEASSTWSAEPSAATETWRIRVLVSEGIASSAGLKHLGRAGIRRRILRKALAQTTGYQERLIAVLGAGGHRLRLIRAEFTLDLRVQLVLPVCAIARELRHASRNRGLAQLQAKIHHGRLRIVHRLLDGFETKHLDLNRAGSFTHLREGIVAVLIGGSDELFLALRRRNRGSGYGYIPRLHESALRVKRRAKGHQRQPTQRDRFRQGQKAFCLNTFEHRTRHPQAIGRWGWTRGYRKEWGETATAS